jgi:hypothetical protein
MKKLNEEKRKLNEFTPTTVERLTVIEEKIKQIKEGKKIEQQTIVDLDNLIYEVQVLRSSFVQNLINWMKQGYIID